MYNEEKVFEELGNCLLRLYCRNCIYDITQISKWTFRDKLMAEIALRWNLKYAILPSEETFFRAFRRKDRSSGMKEKMSLLYFAATDPDISKKMNDAFIAISEKQRIQSLPYWDKFVKQYITANIDQNIANTISTGNQAQAELILQQLDAEEKLHLLEVFQKERRQLGYDLSFIHKIEKLEKQFKFEEAGLMLEEIQNKDELTLAWKYIQRGWYKEIKGQYEQSIELYAKATKLCPGQADFWHYLGNAQCAIDKLDEAIKTQMHALEINLKQYGPVHYQTSVSYNNLFLAWFSKGNYKKAKQYILKAKKIFEQTLPTASEDFVILYHNLGMLESMLDNQKNALLYTYKAVEMAEEYLGIYNDETAKAYHNLGHNLSEAKLYDEAIPWLEKALEVEIKVFGENHHSIAQTLNSIGIIWFQKAEYSNALFCTKTSLEIVRKTFPLFHNETGLRYNNLGRILTKMKRFNESFQNLNEAKKIYSKILPPDHHKLGLCASNFAALYYEQGDYKQAIKYARKAKRIFSKHFSKNHYRMVDIKTLLDNCKKYLS